MTDSDDFWLDDEAPKEDTQDGLIVLSDYFYEKQHGRIGTGFKSLDFILGGLGEASLTVLTGKRGEGKCFAKGTKVVMHDGSLKSVEDVSVGDKLMGIDGSPRNVVELSNGYGELFNVNQTRGINYTVNGQHILCLWQNPEYNNKGLRYKDFGEYIEISVNDYMKLGKTKRESFKGYSTSVQFPSKDITIDPYFLGVWLGDGTSENTSITNMDEEVIDFVYEHDSRIGVPSIISQSLRQKMKDYDLFFNKHIPDDYKFNSRDVRLNVLAGLIDTDGYLYHNCYYLTLKNKSLCEDVKYVANSLGFKFNFKEIKKTCYNNGVTEVYYSASIYGNVESIPVKIQRKKIVSVNKNKNTFATGIKIESVGYGEYFGFEVDDDHKFLLEDFTVTHNSTLAGQLALNAIQNGHKVCFYSGELSAHMFQNWVFSQASGDNHMIKIQDQFGNDFWIVEPIIESRIRSWLGKDLILYDNKVNKHSERNSILERFKIAREKYGCTLFFVDNMMTAKFSIDKERDYWRAQSNFAGELVDFAQENSSHVILVAHPKKGDSGDINDDVSGSSDITNRASNVIQVKRTTEKERIETNADAFITISKNRDYGRTGKIRMKFHPASRRLMDMDNENFEDYSWVDHF